MSRLTQKGATGVLSLFQTISETVATAPFSYSSTFAGERFDAADGREFVLVQPSTATTVAAGKHYQSPAIIANHQHLVVTANTAASTVTGLPATTTVTLGGTAVTVNQYAGGYGIVYDGTGAGQTLKIASHPAQASTTGNVVITWEDAPVTALDTTSVINLIPNPYTNVIIGPTTATGQTVGVGLYPIAASTSTVNSFGLIQTKGTVAGLAQGTITVGTPVSISGSVAGAFAQTPYAGNVVTGSILGYAVQAGVDTKYSAIYLDL